MTDDANMAVAEYIERAVQRSRKTQKEISEEAGYPMPNILSMLKKGQSKLPLDRVVSLSRALETPPEELFLLVLNRLYPDPADNPLMQIFRGIIPTQTEVAMLDIIRKANKGPVNLPNGDERVAAAAEAVIKVIKH